MRLLSCVFFMIFAGCDDGTDGTVLPLPGDIGVDDGVEVDAGLEQDRGADVGPDARPMAVDAALDMPAIEPDMPDAMRPTCNDRRQNGTETGVDCGGDCPPCPTCDDGRRNGGETGVDCGGPCPECVGCNPDAKRVFVTSMAYNGDLQAQGGGESGLEGADNLCNLHAQAADLEGTWVAWLSNDDIDAIDRLPDLGPWYATNQCTQLFRNRASIAVSGPQSAIDRDENNRVGPPINVWTGTEPNGRRSGFDCTQWSNRAFNVEGSVGVGSNNLLPGGWTEVATNPCDREARLFCFEI
jgi:hypothetical protein